MPNENKREFLDSAVLAKLMGLPMHARHPMVGSVSGMHRSPVRGSSLEFAEYRKYVPGDDLRRLDWRAWGRSDRYYIKEFEADTNLRLIFLMDVSGSMRFELPSSEKPDTRLDYARRMAGALSYIAAHQGDAVGLWASGDPKSRRATPIHLPARRGAAHLGAVLDQLGSLQAGGSTTLLKSLHEAADQIPQRAFIVILSDLFADAAELRKAVQHLRFRKHDVAVFHLLDKQEVEFNFDRPARFTDLEGAEPILTDPQDIAQAYRSAVGDWLEEIDDIVRTSAIDYHRIYTDEPYDRVLARFLLSRTPKQSSR